MHDAVARSINVMWERYYEPISLADLAYAANLSRFRYSRAFRSTTGASPGRFLSAVRLHQAKSLLLESSMSVADISYQVGYNSPDSFESRFTRSVGIAPTGYREMPGSVFPPPASASRQGEPSVYGTLSMPESHTPLRTYVAVFGTPVAEGVPVACDVVEHSSRFSLHDIPDGVWHVRATAVKYLDVDPNPAKRRPMFVGGSAAITVKAGRVVETHLNLREMSVFDLPVLLAIPELDSRDVAAPLRIEADDDCVLPQGRWSAPLIAPHQLTKITRIA